MVTAFSSATRSLALALLLCGHAAPFQPSPHPGAKPRQSPAPVGGASASSSPLFRRRRGPVLMSRSAAIEERTAALSLSDGARTAPAPEAETDDGGAQLGAWIPIGSASALAGLGPQRVRTMGLDLVVWHKPPAEDDASKGKGSKKGRLFRRMFRRKEHRASHTAPTEWAVQHDACPHRLAPLSQGRVDPETGCVECPYHGWQFDADGTLTSLPQIEEGRSLGAVRGRGGNARSLPVHVAGDAIFAFLPAAVHGESFPRGLLPEEQYPYLADAASAGKKYFVRELPYSADFLIENFMDPAHIPFAHHSMQSVRDDGTPMEMKMIVSNFTHVEVGFKDISRGKERDGIVSFQRPSLYHFRLRKDGGDYEPSLCIFITPVEAGRSRVLFPGISTPFLPTWVEHALGNRFLNTDTWLHDAERTARAEGGGGGGDAGGRPNYVYGSRSDLGVSAFRQWWAAHGFMDAPRGTYGPADASDLGPRALTRREQIDPWESHSKHCSECRSAIGAMKRGQVAALVGAALSAVLWRGRPAVSVAAVGLGIGANVFLKKCATVIEGNPYTSGVDDRSPAAK